MTASNHRFVRAIAVALLLVSMGHANLLVAEGTAGPQIGKIIEKLPAQNAAAAAEISEALVKTGPAGFERLVSMLVPPGKGDDAKARLALHGLAIYVSRPGAKDERKAFVRSVAGQIDRELPVEVKGFLIRQLQIAGGGEATQTLGRALLHEKLCEYAAQALLTIGPGAVSEFRHALPNAKGACRLTIIQALGILRDRQSVPALLQAAAGKNRDVRLAALSALSNAGDPRAAHTLMTAAAATEPYERIKATDACLLFAQRLVEANEKRSAGLIYRHLWDGRTATEDRHVRCAALEGLTSLLGIGATDVLLSGLKSEDPQIRAAAAQAAISLPGQDATRRWLKEMGKAEPSVRAEILGVLAGRGDRLALPATFDAMKDADESARVAAISTAAVLGKEASIKRLVEFLNSSSSRERGAARDALRRMPGEAAIAGMADLVPNAPVKARAELLGILGKREAKPHMPIILAAAEDRDESVRVAALGALASLADAKSLPRLLDLLTKDETSRVKQATEKAAASVCSRASDKNKAAGLVLARIPKANIASRCALLRVSARTGTGKALSAARTALEDENAKIQDAAVRSLADWPDVGAAEALLATAQGEAKLIHRVLALRGYIRLAGVHGKRKPKEALRMYGEAIRAAARPEEKKQALGGISALSNPDALKAAQDYLKEPDLKAEAAAATVKIARAIHKKQRSEAKAAVRNVLKLAADTPAAKDARELMDTMDKDAGYITTWQASGPYTKPGKKGNEIFDVAFPPEDPDAKDVKWQRFRARTDRKKPWLLDLAKFARGNNRAGYLRTHIWAPKKQEAKLELGSDDGVKAWLNGKVIHSKNALRSMKAGEDKLKIALDKGWNMLMLKVTNNGGHWSAAARLRHPDGGEIESIRISAERKE